MTDTQWQFPHRRFNPLSNQWVLVSPHRTARPWQGEVGAKAAFSETSYDPQCYLCPGNERAGGHKNPAYEGVFTFVNDYAALMPELPPEALQSSEKGSDLLVAQAERGLCKVICFHPNHSLTLARMSVPDMTRVVDTWAFETEELGSLPWINYVQVFENRGAMMGASNPHPHCQVWSTSHIPDEPQAELTAQREYLQRKGTTLLQDYLATELKDGSRLVCQNQDFVVVVPWWAVWPFETLVLPRRHIASLPELSAAEREGLASILKELTTRYDNLFETSFPYTMGFHQAPTDGQPHPEWDLHAHFYPPLLRSATVKKFMVGFEMLGMPQRDITPELAAERLRNLSAVHFTEV